MSACAKLYVALKNQTKLDLALTILYNVWASTPGQREGALEEWQRLKIAIRALEARVDERVSIAMAQVERDNEIHFSIEREREAIVDTSIPMQHPSFAGERGWLIARGFARGWQEAVLAFREAVRARSRKEAAGEDDSRARCKNGEG